MSKDVSKREIKRYRKKYGKNTFMAWRIGGQLFNTKQEAFRAIKEGRIKLPKI